MIYRSLQDSSDSPRESKRGKYKRNNDARDAIKQHIFTYGPQISHYRREHAPNRLYLPSDLTEKAMYNHYIATQTPKASYSLYCKVVKKCNISFVRLGNEQCEACVAAEQHKKAVVHSDPDPEDCDTCAAHTLHHKRFTESRMAYREDGDSTTPDEIVFSVDLQKVFQENSQQFTFL